MLDLQAPGASMTWRISRSLSSYVLASGGTILVTDGVQDDDLEFSFPRAEASWVPGHDGVDVVRFVGSVTFLAHDGLLRFEIIEPAVVRTTTTATVEVTAPWDAEERIVLAHFVDENEKTGSEDVNLTVATPVLSAAGCDVFGGYYPIGTRLEPLTYRSQP